MKPRLERTPEIVKIVDLTHDGRGVARTDGKAVFVDGALPGYIMKANPQVGDNYYQEYDVGEAVDEGTVLALAESVTVPAGSFDEVLRIRDSSALFADFGHKSYAPGIGTILELEFDEDGVHVGTVELVSVVPEPTTAWLLAIGGCCLSVCCRRRRAYRGPG